MKNILIHCAMKKEGEQIAKKLKLSKVCKYDKDIKDSQKIEDKRKNINNFIEVYSNNLNNLKDVYLNDKNSNLKNAEHNSHEEDETNLSLIITGIGKQKNSNCTYKIFMRK